MTFTKAEKESRYRTLQKILEKERLQALLLIGDTSVGHHVYGDFRYYTDNPIIFYRQAVVVFPQSEPVLLAGSEIQREGAAQRSFIKDCRMSENLVADVTALLMEHGVSSGKIGVNLEMLPVAWDHFLRRELPQVEWVDTHDLIMDLRFHRSEEEVEIYRKGASLGDGGYESVLEMIRPGVSEHELAAEIEYYARARGAEDHFTLIGSGKFSLGEDSTLSLPYVPSSRRIEVGDSVVMEISPRFGGYWTQLVRTVNVGKPNSDLEKIHQVCRDAIRRGLEQFKPGKRVKDMVLAMEDCVKAYGYLFRPPTGHVCGIDLVEARVTAKNEMVLEPGTAVIIHPTVFTPDGKRIFFWGETYLVTQEGYDRLHTSADELLTI